MNCHIHTLQNRFTFRHVIPLLLLFVFYGAASQGETTFVVQIETHPFQGVRYLRCEKAAPDPQVAHLIEIELDAPGIRFTTTGTNGTDAPRETWCETTLEFVKKTGAQIGINGNYFIYDNERHTELIGLAVSDGEIVSPWDTSTSRFALHISKENKAALIERPNTSADTIPPQPKVNLYNAVGGRPLLLRDGTV
ncbi:MAG: phosphodiester glycosidase family protein, partial [Candidatus Hydrogenedentes bacterium]|nr:phosphodiester glycosidase family protein [Candidatus Hydrogenedentota bacterium]